MSNDLIREDDPLRGVGPPESEAIARLKRGALQRTLEAGQKAGFDAALDAAPPDVVRLELDAPDADQLLVRVRNFSPGARPSEHDGGTQQDLDKIRAFPQRKWSADEQAWMIPLTTANVEWLLQTWPPGALRCTDAASLLLRYHVLTMLAAERKLKERAEFLEAATDPAGANNVGEKFKDPDLVEALRGYPHQDVCFSSMKDAEFFALLMEMGTGKTKPVIDTICYRARKMLNVWEAKPEVDRGPRPQFRALIVAPKTICHNWTLEIAKHATVDWNVERLRGSKNRRADALSRLIADRENPDDENSPRMNSPVICGIVNYEGLDKIPEGLLLVPWDVVVLDESTWIKNPSAKRSKAACKVGERAKSRFILTGTPISKNVLDLYGQFNFLSPGTLGYDSYYAFAGRYDHRNTNPTRYKTLILPELMERMSKFSFVIKRAQCVDLPAKQYVVRDVEMSEEQSDCYQQMAEDLIVTLESEEAGHLEQLDALMGDSDFNGHAGMEYSATSVQSGEDKFSLAQNVAVRVLRLAQITGGFMKMANGDVRRFSEQPKLDALDEILEELDDAAKIVVWCRFREEIEMVTERMGKNKIWAVKLYGGLSDAVRERNIESFRTDPRCRVFVGQAQSGGFGLNLVEASNVVYYSNDWILQNRLQSEDRCHRIGQTKSVVYADLTVPNTVDQMISQRLAERRDMLEFLTNRGGVIKALRSQLSALRAQREGGI